VLTVDLEDGHRGIEPTARRRVHDHEHGLGIFDHERQAFCGVIRFHRDVRGSGLGHAEQGDDQLQAAFEADANEPAWRRAAGPESMRQPVRSRLDLGERP
jgi:hypothetical protein